MRRLIVWCALSALAACDFGSEQAQTLLNFCEAEEQCAQGVCEESLCIDDSGSSVDVIVQVLRSGSDVEGLTPRSWAFEPVSLSGSTARDYVLPRTRDVVGRVRLGEVEVPAELRFLRRVESALSSLSAEPVTAGTRGEPIGLPGQGLVDYQTKLVEGASYDVVVAPTSDVLVELGEDSTPALRILPPLYLDDVLIGKGDGAFRLDVSFPSDLVEDCSIEVLSGCTFRGAIASTNGFLVTTEPGLQVRAVELDTGRLVSSIGETNEQGRFAIRISAQAKEYRIRVTSVPGAEPFPSILLDPEEIFSEAPGELGVLIPRLPTVPFSGRVVDAGGRPVPNASLRLSSDSVFDDSVQLLGEELVGTFTATAVTDLQGRFEVELLPGMYEVLVTPPVSEQNAWGVLLTEALVTGMGDEPDALYTVPPQLAFSGSVLTPQGEPAAGVTVQAKARTHPSSSSMLGQEDLARSSPQETTNAGGEFSMHLDAGRFDLRITPDSQTGFPWIVDPDLDFTDEQGSQMRDYSLPAPIVARGTITASDGTAASKATIRAYAFVGQGQDRRVVEVGEAVTDGNGSYRLLIAPAWGGE